MLFCFRRLNGLSHLPLTKMVLCQFSLHLSNCHCHIFSEAPKVDNLDHSHLNPNIIVILNVENYCIFSFFTKSLLLPHSRSPSTLINIMCCAVLCLVAQSCPTLCDSLGCSCHAPVHGILQARILEWVAMPLSSRASS